MIEKRQEGAEDHNTRDAHTVCCGGACIVQKKILQKADMVRVRYARFARTHHMSMEVRLQAPKARSGHGAHSMESVRRMRWNMSASDRNMTVGYPSKSIGVRTDVSSLSWNRHLCASFGFGRRHGIPSCRIRAAAKKNSRLVPQYLRNGKSLRPRYAVYRYFVVKTDPFTEHTARPQCLQGKRPVGW